MGMLGLSAFLRRMVFWKMSDGVHPHLAEFFPQKARDQIKQAVLRVEATTSAQIRVEVKMDYDADIHSAATQIRFDFARHGMDKTRDRNGVFVLLVWRRRAFAIFADHGIYGKLPQEYWDARALELTQRFRDNNFAEAIVVVVDEIGVKLAEFFPKKPDGTDELPNDVIVEE